MDLELNGGTAIVTGGSKGIGKAIARELALEGVEQETIVGLRTTLDVLDAEQEVFAARVNLVSAERDAVVSSYWVKATVGELTAAALGLPVERYDADAHYRSVKDKWFGLSAD